MQHAIGSRPDPAHGYCVDDVARALQVDLLHGASWAGRRSRDVRWRRCASSRTRSTRRSGRFRNFRVDRRLVDRRGLGSEDCHGRAVLALGDTDRDRAAIRALVDRRDLLSSTRAAGAPATSPRPGPRRRVVLGCAARSPASPSRADAALPTARRAPRRLTARPVRAGAPADWPWPEPVLTYENALLARALIVAGARARRSEPMVDAWALGRSTGSSTSRPRRTATSRRSGTSWWPRGGARSQFDQQPIEATALLLAAESAYDGDRRPPLRRRRWSGPTRGSSARNDVGVLRSPIPARGAVLRRPDPDGPQHERGCRVDPDVAHRGRAHPGDPRAARCRASRPLEPPRAPVQVAPA